MHDAIVTLDREVTCFGTAKRTGASLLFLANKLISVTLYVIACVGFTPLLQVGGQTSSMHRLSAMNR